jgi:hypothetical protein
MVLLPRKFIALLLAAWLPLFSGNALAVSFVMQTMGGGCHAVMQSSSVHHGASLHQHMQHGYQHMHHEVHLAQQVQQHDMQNNHQQNSHKECGVCQLACCGYMAAVVTEAPQIQPLTQLFMPVVTQFQSVSSTPLDPPPLALA